MNKQRIILMGLAAATLGLVACSDSHTNADRMEQRVDHAMDELRRDKDAARDELRGLRDRISDHLAAIDRELEDPALTDAERTELMEEKAELNAQQLRVDAALVDVESALENTWNDVKRTTSTVAKDVTDWFERQAEKVDEATDADHDGDGK